MPRLEEIPEDLSKALTRLRDVQANVMDAVESNEDVLDLRPRGHLSGTIIDAEPAVRLIDEDAAARPSDAQVPGATLNNRISDNAAVVVTRADVSLPAQSRDEDDEARRFYRQYIRELPANWSSRIVACLQEADDADELHSDSIESIESIESIGTADMSGVRHSVRRSTHAVLFLWNNHNAFYVLDASDNEVHGADIEQHYSRWEITPSDFQRFLGGATRYPDRGARSRRIFFKR